MSEVEDQLNEIKQEGKIREKRVEKWLSESKEESPHYNLTMLTP